MQKEIKLEEPAPRNADTKTIIYCLLSERDWLRLLPLDGKPYGSMVDYLLAKPIDDYQIHSTKLKDIAAELEIKPTSVTAWCQKIYEDIFELNWHQPELFKRHGVKYNMSFYDVWGGLQTFTMWIPKTLSLHDIITWKFIDGSLHSTSFWISKIEHVLNQENESTELTLKSGVYNLHRRSLIDKAKFLNLISFQEFLYLPQWQIDILLYYRVEMGNKNYKLPDDVNTLWNMRFG